MIANTGTRRNTAPAEPPSVKWMRFEPDPEDEDEFVIVDSTPEVINALEASAAPTDPVNLVSIVGPARTGKSFFLAALTQTEGIFQSAAQVDPCTSGVDVARRLFSHEELFNSRATRGNRPRIALLDCEGQGDREVAEDLRLNTPVLLLSKVCIFNWRGHPRKSELLEQLQLLYHTASMVRRKQRSGSESRSFGHLHLVFRDIGNGDTDQASEIRQLLGQVRRSSDINALQKLEGMFESVDFWAFPRPSDDCDTAVPELSSVSTAFVEKMQQFKNVLAEQLSTSHRFGDMQITLSLLAEVVPTIVDAVQSEGFVVPDNVVDGMIRKQLEGVVANAQVSFKAQLDMLQKNNCAGALGKPQRELKAQCEEWAQELIKGLGEVAEHSLQIPAGHKILTNCCNDLEDKLARFSHGLLQEVELEEFKRNTTAIGDAKLALASEIDNIVAEIPFTDAIELENRLRNAKTVSMECLNSVLSGVHQTRQKYGSQPTVAALDTEYERVRSHVVQLNSSGVQVVQQQSFLEAAKQQQQILEQEVQEREHQLMDLRTANQRLERDIEGTKQRMEALQQQNAAMEVETKSLSSQLTTIKSQQEHSQTELNTLKQRNQDLESRIAQQQQGPSVSELLGMFQMMNMGSMGGGGMGGGGMHGGMFYDDVGYCPRSSRRSHSSRSSRPSPVRTNAAGRPIHDNGQFMSYGEARSKGWKG